MEQVSDVKQQKIVNLSRGLFVIRYASAQDVINPPRVNISAGPGSDRHVSIILHPDSSEAVLWQPGSSLVVRATNAARLIVEVVPTVPNSSTAATVKLETLSQGEAAYQSLELQADEPAEFNLEDFRILGHVAGRGDIIVEANEWIAGPSAPSRLEGLAFEWPGKPADIDIKYAVKFGKPNPVTSPLTGIGGFVGSRGRAQPIVGALIELSGAAANSYQLNVDALFLGTPTMRSNGKRVSLSGPTGREPLVGLRVGLQQQNQAATAPKQSIPAPMRSAPVPKPSAPASKRSVQAPAKPVAAEMPKSQTGRVRVFRATTKPVRGQSGK